MPVPFLGTVNLWLLQGDPLDARGHRAPRSDEALYGLERELREHSSRSRTSSCCCWRITISTTPASPRDPGALRRDGRRARRHRRLGRRLPRAGGRRAALHASGCSRTRRPGSARRRHRAVLASTSSAAARTTRRTIVLADGDEHPGRRQDVARRPPPGAQHDRHALRRRRGERGDRRRPPAGQDHLGRRDDAVGPSRPAAAAAPCSTT